jgi:hypothetical protein
MNMPRLVLGEMDSVGCEAVVDDGGMAPMYISPLVHNDKKNYNGTP